MCAVWRAVIYAFVRKNHSGASFLMECFWEFIQKSPRNAFILSTTNPIEFLIMSNQKYSENLNMLRFFIFGSNLEFRHPHFHGVKVTSYWIFNPVKEEVSGGCIRRKYPEEVSAIWRMYPEEVSGGCTQINGSALTM